MRVFLILEYDLINNKEGEMIMESIFKMIDMQKEREQKETWEDTRKDIIANVLKVRKEFIEKNYKKDKINIHTLYFLLEVDLSFFLSNKWFSNERKSQYLYEKSDEFGLTKTKVDVKGIDIKYSVKELEMYDIEKRTYTETAENFINDKVDFNKFYVETLLKRVKILKEEVEIKELLEVMSELIKELETGTYQSQETLVKVVYLNFKLEIELSKFLYKEDERTKELHAKFKTKTFLEKNYYAISENLIKKIVEENRLF